MNQQTNGSSRAIIIGGSVGGLFAAHLLRSIGWDVLVCERSAQNLAERGAAIAMTEELMQVLRASDSASTPHPAWSLRRSPVSIDLDAKFSMCGDGCSAVRGQTFIVHCGNCFRTLASATE